MPIDEPRYFSPAQFNRILFDMAGMAVKHKKQLKLISKKFRSDIMLAVTWVNGCRVCSYFHTQVLLKEGVSSAELKPLLEGTFGDFDSEETTALLFAQHYADTGGNYEAETFNQVKKQYGEEKAIGILATVKMIMFGNVNGIALGNLWDRIRFRKVKYGKILTDLYNAFSPVVLLPVFLVISVFRK